MPSAKTEKSVEKTQTLPPLKNGEIASVISVVVLEKKTKPPVRYTEGLLIEDMKNAGKYIENDPEKKAVLKAVSGLGTSATRDSIIEALKKYNYVELNKNHIIPTSKGEELIRWLDTHCADLTDVAVTAAWEADLDIVAKKGGGAQFEQQIIAKVHNIISTLRQAEPIPRDLSSENNKMSEEQQPNTNNRTSRPTPKMLQFAERIALKLGGTLPAEVSENFDSCKAYIDANIEAASRPSEKQLSFARTIAERRGVEIPPAELADGRLLSKWIDANK